MIKYFKNILTKKHIKYLTILLVGMLIAAVLEMLGLSSIPLFIMIIIDLNVLVNKFPDFFAIDYIKNLGQNYLTIYGGSMLIIIFLIKNIYLSIFLFFQGRVFKILRTDIRNDLFRKYITAPYNFHIKTNPSVLIRNVIQSVDGAMDTYTIKLENKLKKSSFLYSLLKIKRKNCEYSNKIEGIYLNESPTVFCSRWFIEQNIKASASAR